MVVTVYHPLDPFGITKVDEVGGGITTALFAGTISGVTRSDDARRYDVALSSVGVGGHTLVGVAEKDIVWKPTGRTQLQMAGDHLPHGPRPGGVGYLPLLRGHRRPVAYRWEYLHRARDRGGTGSLSLCADALDPE